MKVTKVPHVVVFSNRDPDQSKLSADRWNITRLDPTIDQEIYYPEPLALNITIINISTDSESEMTVTDFVSGKFLTSTPTKVKVEYLNDIETDYPQSSGTVSKDSSELIRLSWLAAEEQYEGDIEDEEEDGELAGPSRKMALTPDEYINI